MAKAALGAAAVATAAVAGAIMAIDNVFGLVPLPLFGIWGDRYRGRLGRRTPFMLVVAAALVPKGDNPDYLPVCMIQALLILGAAVCYGIDGSWELPYFDIGCDTFEARKDGLGDGEPRGHRSHVARRLRREGQSGLSDRHAAQHPDAPLLRGGTLAGWRKAAVRRRASRLVPARAGSPKSPTCGDSPFFRARRSRACTRAHNGWHMQRGRMGRLRGRACSVLGRSTHPTARHRPRNRADLQPTEEIAMKYFGTDGFRGRANEGLTVDHAFKIGRFVGWYYGLREGRKAKVVIGKDTRRSSYMFEYALGAGLVASGADAYLLHVTTTPSVSYVVRSEDFDCGIMITASHNPYTDNGIKLINSGGYKMEPEVLERVEAYIDGKSDVPLATGEDIGRTIDYVEGRNRYIGFLISSASFSLHGYRIGLDCANGASTPIAKGVFDALGAKTYVVSNEPNGFNINRGCGSTHIEQLQNLVNEKGLDVGFAYDGDADRCIAVDEHGKVADGDLIMYACGSYMHKLGQLAKDTMVTTVMSNLGLYKALQREGISYEQTPVGDKYVSACMVENGYSLGGEQSGHVIFSKYSATGDGINTSLRVMEAIIGSKKTLGELTEPVKIYPQLLKNVVVPDKNAVMADERVKAAVANVETALEGEGRAVVRASGTEPMVRVMVEAATPAICEQYVDEVVKVIESL